jgi:hypothetical protein
VIKAGMSTGQEQFGNRVGMHLMHKLSLLNDDRDARNDAAETELPEADENRENRLIRVARSRLICGSGKQPPPGNLRCNLI